MIFTAGREDFHLLGRCLLAQNHLQRMAEAGRCTECLWAATPAASALTKPSHSCTEDRQAPCSPSGIVFPEVFIHAMLSWRLCISISLLSCRLSIHIVSPCHWTIWFILLAWQQGQHSDRVYTFQIILAVAALNCNMLPVVCQQNCTHMRGFQKAIV